MWQRLEGANRLQLGWHGFFSDDHSRWWNPVNPVATGYFLALFSVTCWLAVLSNRAQLFHFCGRRGKSQIMRDVGYHTNIFLICDSWKIALSDYIVHLQLNRHSILMFSRNCYWSFLYFLQESYWEKQICSVCWETTGRSITNMGCVFSGSTDTTDLFLPIDIPGKHKKMSNSNSWKRCECCRSRVSSNVRRTVWNFPTPVRNCLHAKRPSFSSKPILKEGLHK